MHTTFTAQEADKKFRKTYNAAAGGFAFIMGLNTLVLLGIGLLQLNNPSPTFGPPGVVIGMGAGLLGVTLGVTAVIARKQRWGAVVGLVLVILLGCLALANFGTSGAETESGASNPSAPVCGLVIMVIIGLQLIRAIRATPVHVYPPPTPTNHNVNPYQPYGSGQPQYGGPQQPQPPAPGYAPPVPYGSADTGSPRRYTLGTTGAIFLGIGALLFVGGSGAAIASWVAETTVDATAWQRVHDPELQVSLEMPGEPTIKTTPPSDDVVYETQYTVERHQYLTQLTCTRLAQGWYFEEDEFREGLEAHFEPQFIVSQSTTRTTVNGIPFTRVDYELLDGEVGVVVGHHDGREAIVVSINTTSAVGEGLIGRVLNSIERDQ